MSKKSNGFTLVEIMIVVAIIIVILTLALPSMLRSRMNANEVAAIGHCRLIANACQSYYSNRQPHEYPLHSGPAGLNGIAAPASDPPYIDSTLAAGDKQGYAFVYTRISEERFSLRANPNTPGRTGIRYFYVDETGVIRANASGPAGAGDTPVSG